MNRVFVAALELQSALKDIGRPFCFIGGLALQRWGETRYTQDADATVICAFEFDEEVAQSLLLRFKPGGPMEWLLPCEIASLCCKQATGSASMWRSERWILRPGRSSGLPCRGSKP
jgi:hypothetical protein